MNGILRNGVVLEALVDMSFAQNKSVNVKEVLMSDGWWQYINQQRLAIIEKFDVLDFHYDFDWLWKELLPLLDNMSVWEVLSDVMIGLDTVGCAHGLGLDGFAEEDREDIAAILKGKYWETEEEAVRQLFGDVEEASKSKHAYPILKALYAAKGTQELVDYCFANRIKGNDVFIIGRWRWDDLDEMLKICKLPIVFQIDSAYEVDYDEETEYSDELEADEEEPLRPWEAQFDEIREWIEVIQFAKPLTMQHEELGELQGKKIFGGEDGNWVAWLWHTKIDGEDVALRIMGDRFGPTSKETERAKWLVNNFKFDNMRKRIGELWNEVNDCPIPQFGFCYNFEKDEFSIIDKDKQQIGTVYYTYDDFRYSIRQD